MSRKLFGETYKVCSFNKKGKVQKSRYSILCKKYVKWQGGGI